MKVAANVRYDRKTRIAVTISLCCWLLVTFGLYKFVEGDLIFFSIAFAIFSLVFFLILILWWGTRRNPQLRGNYDGKWQVWHPFDMGVSLDGSVKHRQGFGFGANRRNCVISTGWEHAHNFLEIIRVSPENRRKTYRIEILWTKDDREVVFFVDGQAMAAYSYIEHGGWTLPEILTAQPEGSDLKHWSADSNRLAELALAARKEADK